MERIIHVGAPESDTMTNWTKKRINQIGMVYIIMSYSAHIVTAELTFLVIVDVFSLIGRAKDHISYVSL